MRSFILVLGAIGLIHIPMQADVGQQSKQQAAISLRGTVESVRIVKTTPSSAFIDIKLKMELVNTGNQPIIFLKRNPLFVGATLAKNPNDFQTGNVLAADGAWPSNDIAPEWAILRANLDQSAPPSSETRVLMPGESWSLDASAGVDVPTDSKRYTSSRKKESLATIQQLSPVWLRVVCEVWPWNVEPLNPDRNKLKFGHELQERWKGTGRLWLDEIYSEPIILDVRTATERRTL